jgi:hypothetical protein
MATNNRRGTLLRASTDWLADEHSQRDMEREFDEVAPPAPRRTVRSYPRTRSADGQTFILRDVAKKLGGGS